MGKTSVEVKERYNSKTYDKITFRVYKGGADKIRSAAEAAGLSLNAYINQAIQDKLNKKA